MSSSGNFSFLAEHSLLLADLGAAAQRLFPIDPASCVLRSRLLAKAFTEGIVRRLSVQLTQPAQAGLLRAVNVLLDMESRVWQVVHVLRRGSNRTLPALEAQAEIDRRVKTLPAFADRLKASLSQARTAVDRLTSSLQAKAFRGELVPQDLADKPAAGLLKRLQSSVAKKPAADRPRCRAAAAGS